MFEIYANIKLHKLHENPSSGSRVVPCGRTNMTKLTVAFRHFESASKVRTDVSITLQIPHTPDRPRTWAFGVKGLKLKA